MTEEIDKFKNSKKFSPAFKLLLDFAEKRGLLKEASKNTQLKEEKQNWNEVLENLGVNPV